jgi:hypothetical protein
MAAATTQAICNGFFGMRTCLLVGGVAMLLAAFSPMASAEIRFVCHTMAPLECAFSVIDKDGNGTTNFVLAPNQTHGLNDTFASGSYCVVVSKPRAQVKDWPPKCNSVDPHAFTKIGRNIQPGRTYD